MMFQHNNRNSTLVKAKHVIYRYCEIYGFQAVQVIFQPVQSWKKLTLFNFSTFDQTHFDSVENKHEPELCSICQTCPRKILSNNFCSTAVVKNETSGNAFLSTVSLFGQCSHERWNTLRSVDIPWWWNNEVLGRGFINKKFLLRLRRNRWRLFR